jgi:uncharacterized membrane protein YjjP (DUF1212 family)
MKIPIPIPPGKQAQPESAGPGPPAIPDERPALQGQALQDRDKQNHDTAVAFAIKLGRALHEYGTPTYRLEAAMASVVERFGLRGQFFAIPTGIFASFGAPEEQRTALIRVQPSTVDLQKMALLDELTAQVIRSQVTAAEGIRRVDEIIAARPSYSPLLTVLAYGIASGTGSRFFAGGWREVVAATGIGILLGLLELVMDRSDDAQKLFEPAAAVLVSALAITAAKIMPPISAANVTVAGLFVLFPGLTLTVGIRDLATRNLLSGSAMLTAAGLVFLELGFGVALGTQVNRLMRIPPPPLDPIPLPPWTIWLALLLSPLAFGALLRARKSDLGWILLAGILSFTGARVGALLVGPELGVFLGALLIGVASNLYARVLNRPSAITLVPGMLLLVPGSVGFISLSKFLQNDVVSGVETAFKMVLIAIALVTGLLLANLLVKPRLAV